jgi:hypothetical protein
MAAAFALSRPAQPKAKQDGRGCPTGRVSCVMQVQTPETIETTGPHPGFAHLLPSRFAFGCAGRAKAITSKLLVGGKNKIR